MVTTKKKQVVSNQKQIDEIAKGMRTITFGNKEDRLMRAERKAAEAGAPAPEMRAGIINPTETNQKAIQEIKNSPALQQLDIQQQAEAEALRNKYLNATPTEQEKLRQEHPMINFAVSRATRGLSPELSKLGNIARIGTNIEGDLTLAGATAATIGVGAPAAIPAIASFKGVALATGLLSASGLGFNSIRKLVTSGRVKDIEEDITELAASTRSVSTDVKNGFDPQEALITIEMVESAIIAREGDLHQAMTTDVEGRLKGENSEEFMFKQLSLVQSRKFAIQKYMIDHDINALNAVMGIDATALE